MTEIAITTPLTTLPSDAGAVATETRNWKAEPDGEFDRPVEIWYNNNWVPAFFSDLHSGDFFLDLKANLDPGRCFKATSDILRSVYKGKASFIVKGLEIVQAPEHVEKVVEALPEPTLLALSNPKELNES